MGVKHGLGRAARWIFAKPNYFGLLAGTAWFCMSITPSLLPRPWLLQAIVAGISFAVGYAIGVFISWTLRKLVRRELPEDIKRYAWPVGLTICGLCIVIFTGLSLAWQNEVRALVDEPALNSGHRILMALASLVVATVLIWAGRLIHWMVRRTDRLLVRWVPRRLTGAMAVLVVAVFLYLIFNGVAFRMFINSANDVYRSANNTTPAGVKRPTNPLRSGSPESFVSWESLGKQGRRYVGTGPSLKQLRQFSGQQPTEPIRVYAGINSASTIKQRSEIAVKELERTHAFDRPILVVITPTGTGWVQPQSIDSLEYMWNGDIASVAVQYSYLPSWISFMVDKQNATDAGRELFSQVYAKWSHLPKNQRPKLIVYGLSLGSFGMQAAFSGQEDLSLRTAGALFAGTPHDTFLLQDIERNRDSGSSAWQPIYDKGKIIRFTDNGKALQKSYGKWSKPRVVYLQNASDPIVWWSFDLLLRKPEWLSEPRGPDVLAKMQWYPLATFLHVTVDQFFGATARDGHGHNYSTAPVDAWAAITPPSGWNNAKSDHLRRLIAHYKDQ